MGEKTPVIRGVLPGPLQISFFFSPQVYTHLCSAIYYYTGPISPAFLAGFWAHQFAKDLMFSPRIHNSSGLECEISIDQGRSSIELSNFIESGFIQYIYIYYIYTGIYQYSI